MNKETSGYDPMSVRNMVDDIYSSHEIQEHLRAQRSISRERSAIHFRRVIRVETIMNPQVAELFGERSQPDGLMSITKRVRISDDDSTAEN